MQLYVGLLLFVFTTSVHADFTFTPLEPQTISQLNKILTKERDVFSSGTPKTYKLPHYSPAKYDVELFKVAYDSVIPEQANKSTKAFGLLAIPKIRDASALPIVSYQHGTVFGKHDVPSYSFSDPINPAAYETRLMVAQFAGQGYMVIAADYFGMGDSIEPEAYSVKASEQQACIDLYEAAIQFLKQEKKLSQTDLFLAGWSQGGFVTTAFLEKLESRNIPVKAASTASAPNDIFAALNGWIYHPRKIDAVWLNTLVGLTAFSYENYFSKQGLARDVIKAAYYNDMRKIYERDYSGIDELKAIVKSLPTDFKKLLNDKYSDPGYFVDSDYGKILSDMQTYRRVFKTPVKMYYGMLDEVIAIPIGKLASIYQKSMGSQSIVTEPVKSGDHHATFLTSVARQKEWFDKLQSH
ncbi:alpha/beta fold hydrolase [Methylobacter sp. S3L5C]|uniref:alpha/beta hydrolase n=1 Tax=Methylobacter sp. S3L5C TaxID=2839024 RepID=UPI001FADA846|nr:alpha/beta fold hydrolase [Methylobacter sp. S3L5C]UOA09552.1 alpha/beta hydrolase [Methylobacter sp. S3L5C]